MKIGAALGYLNIIQVLPVDLKDSRYIRPFRQGMFEIQSGILYMYEVSRGTRLRKLRVKVLLGTMHMFPFLWKQLGGNNNVFQPKMSCSLSFSGMWQKLFIGRRDRTNYQ